MNILVDKKDQWILEKYKWYISTAGYVVAYEIGKTHKTRKKLYLHRVILNAPKKYQIDHINLNKLDNRRSNLRRATGRENRLNRLVQSNNKSSGLKGVYPSGKKWRARIQVDGTRHDLGVFDNPTEAARVYDEAVRFWFGAYGRGNFI